jgi:hypothetical protein
MSLWPFLMMEKISPSVRSWSVAGFGGVGNREFHVLGSFAFAVAIFAVADGAIERPPSFGASYRLERGLDRIRLFGASTGIAAYVGVICGVEVEACCAESASATRKRAGRTSVKRYPGTSSWNLTVAYSRIAAPMGAGT